MLFKPFHIKYLFSFLLAILWSSIAYGEVNKTRIACVGNSVTYGAGIENREVNSYPAQLQELMGEKYEVGNFGKSGATLLTNGHRPYIQQEEFQQALKFKPQIVVIHLGLNDTDPRNWPNYRQDFVKDYSALIDSFRNLSSSPEVWICKMTPIFHEHPRFKSGTRDWFWHIQEKIEIIAKGKNTELIDFHTPLYSRPDLMPDNLHPNKEGAGILAKTVYQRLTGDFGGLQIPEVFNFGMVLQREIPIPVYGKANSGDSIWVKLEDDLLKTNADKYGNWKVEFPEKKAGGPYTLMVGGRGKRIVIDNVLIGDLYLCSGQSNMSFELKSTARAKEEIVKANFPEIRLFNMKAVAWGGKYKWSEEQLEKTNQLEFFSGKWEYCTPETADEFSAIAYHFGRKLYEETGVPIGLIHNSKGGSPTEAWIDRKTLELNPQLVDVLMNWEKNDFVQTFCRERATFNIQDSNNPLQRHPFHPAYLYEAGIEPLKGLPIKGVIWYQGESNAHNVEFYEQLFPALVESWRNIWGEDLPFYFVQLSSINRPSWGHFRDSQRRLASQIPNCEMAVSSDMGHPTNVHPNKKKEVGERLALITMKNLYAKDVPWQGPEVMAFQFNKNKIEVDYTFANELKTSDDKTLRSFEVAGEDEIYKAAKTKIKGNTIEIWSDEVINPKHFRYGWSAYTDANLINEAGLPASTFSTEFEKNVNK